MCGIAGYIGSRTIANAQITTCLTRMRQRGPDHAAHSHWVNPAGKHVNLLHTRLGIIDLDERANQPFGAGDKWMVLNGELYNYVELRRELEVRGVPLRTSSDTEVLLQTIACNGWDALDRCEGMWAFGVYDAGDGSLTLCRDRFGEKPLYLFRDATGLYFGSEVKLISALLGQRLEVNYDHIFRNMIHGYKALYKAGQTFFRGLIELPRASTLHIDANGHETPATYWKPSYATDEAMSHDEAVAGVRQRLIRSMELRLRADVPLAFCMSGGIDSNSLICMAKKILGYDVHGFTIVNEDKRYDEWEQVSAVVTNLGLRHTAIPVNTSGFLQGLRTLVLYHDGPVYTINYYSHWQLMAQVKAHGYRISVSGNGSDELFTGYYDHHLMYLAETRDPAALQAWQTHVLPHIRNAKLRDPNQFVQNPGFRDHLFMDGDAFVSYLTHPWQEAFEEVAYAPNLLRNRMLNEMFHETVPPTLHMDDLNAMYYSVENRSPFLDRDLFEFCSRIPTRHLMRNGLTKVILRDAMRGIVPDSILDNRRKVGFNAPVFAYLDVRDPHVRNAVLDRSPIYDHVPRDKVEALMSRTDLPNSESKFLFSFLGTKLFLEEFE